MFAFADTIPAAANVATTAVTTTAPAAGTDYVGLIIYCVIIFAVIYFLMILPNKRRMRDYKSMIDKLAVGNKILLSGGIYGVIKSIEGDKMTVEIAKGVVVDVPKSAVAGIE